MNKLQKFHELQNRELAEWKSTIFCFFLERINRTLGGGGGGGKITCTLFKNVDHVSWREIRM